ncbi:MAG TPA: aminotransferase class I/II-fold pyridoxal phosphate-dependent enzyme [Candidatus Eremiobacteraceae bacterium]|nr:aminotransferase class I/II-fold pyridoxal phosphate-dependent enzyme [Candidatus Eremiobacteraceae bacterium]
MTKTQFDAISLERLRQRRSEKWATYPPDVLPAFVAEMDFDLAAPIREAIDEAVARGDVGYAHSAGVSAAFAHFARDRFTWDVDETAFFAVPDVMAGVAEALHILTPPGARVVINPPVYAPFYDVIPHEGRTIAAAPLAQDESGRWSLDFDALERAFASGARAYLLCSPHNPVGRVWTQAELRELIALCERYGVALISDESHAPLTMPGIVFTAAPSVSGELPCIALWSASKAFNIAGLKCAVIGAAPEHIRDKLRARLKSRPDEVESRIGHLGVIATIAAFRHAAPWLDSLRDYLDGNRRLLGDLLRERLPDVRYAPPEATYLAWLDCTRLAIDGDPSRRFLERGRVALEPGRKFGPFADRFVRLNMGTSRAILDEIVTRMAKALR